MANNAVLEVILGWVPMLLLIGVWIYLMRRNIGPFGAQHRIVEEYRQHNELLRTIIDRMDQRITRLEGADREQNK